MGTKQKPNQYLRHNTPKQWKINLLKKVLKFFIFSRIKNDRHQVFIRSSLCICCSLCISCSLCLEIFLSFPPPGKIHFMPQTQIKLSSDGFLNSPSYAAGPPEKPELFTGNASRKVRVLVAPGHHDKIPQMGWLNQQTFSHSSGGWSQHGAAVVGSLPGVKIVTFLLCPHCQRANKLSGLSLLRTLSPLWALRPCNLTKAPLQFLILGN